jgi:hypothetical protein
MLSSQFRKRFHYQPALRLHCIQRFRVVKSCPLFIFVVSCHTLDVSFLKCTIEHFTTISKSSGPYARFFVIPNSTYMPLYIQHNFLPTLSSPSRFMQNKCSACYLCFGIKIRFLSLKWKKVSVWNTDRRYEGIRCKAHQQQPQLKLKTSLSPVTGINFRLHKYCLSIFSSVNLCSFYLLEFFTHVLGNAFIVHS